MEAIVFKSGGGDPFQFGMLIGPPKVLEAPKPMSSIKTTTTFGAPLVLSPRSGRVPLHCGRPVPCRSVWLVP